MLRRRRCVEDEVKGLGVQESQQMGFPNEREYVVEVNKGYRNPVDTIFC